MDTLELQKLFQPLTRWMWLLIASGLIAATATALTVQEQSLVYQSSTTLIVGNALFEPNPSPSGTELTVANQLATTYASMAQRATVYEATKNALGLDSLPDYQVQQLLNTQIIEIVVRDVDPTRAQAVATELANQLIAQTPEGQIRDDRRTFVEQQLDTLEASIEDTQTSIDNLKRELETMFSARQIADANSQLVALESKLLTLQANYAEMLANSQRDATNTLRVLEPANFPSMPLEDGSLTYILAAGLLGIAVAAAASYVLTYLDDTFHGEDEVREHLAVATLGHIPVQRKRLSEEDKLRWAMRGQSLTTDAYGALTLSLEHALGGHTLRTMLISSPSVGTNHSSVTAHLGIMLAHSGKRVVLVDGDLQRPALQRIFGIRNHLGLSTLLQDVTAEVIDSLHTTALPGLMVLTSGPLPPNSTQLLSSQRLSNVLAQLQDYADIVLIDAPPLTVTVDASILATQVDGVLMVIANGRTRRKLSQSAIKILRQIGANLLGVVLTELPNKQLMFAGRKDYNVSAIALPDLSATDDVSAFVPYTNRVNGKRRPQQPTTEPPSNTAHQNGTQKSQTMDVTSYVTLNQNGTYKAQTKVDKSKDVQEPNE